MLRPLAAFNGYLAATNGGTNRVLIDATSAMTLGVTQSPSYSWIQQSNTSQYWWKNYNLYDDSSGYMALSGYPSISGYNNNKFTHFMTMKLYLADGLTDNQGIKMDMRFKDTGWDYFTSNFAYVYGYNTPVRLQINFPMVPGTEMPEGDYQNYNGRWLTIVGSASNVSTDFSNWTGGSATGSQDQATRLTIFDTETGELLQRSDAWQTRSNVIGLVPNISTWIANASGNISTNQSDNISWSINGPAGAPAGNSTITITNYWMSLGTMFDPIAESINESNTSWRTTRPSRQIGNAHAWINMQSTTIGNEADYVRAWGDSSGMDTYVQANNRQINLIDFDGNTVVFNNRYSTTDVPKTTG